MPHILIDSFAEGTEIVRVYLAGSLREAQAVEGVLDGAGVEYATETERYAAPGSLGLWQRTGVGFWVIGSGLDGAADALARAGMVKGLVLRETHSSPGPEAARSGSPARRSRRR